MAADCRPPLRSVNPAAPSPSAWQTLKWAAQHLGLLDNALDHLTLGRAALYAAILERPAAVSGPNRSTIKRWWGERPREPARG